MTLIKNNPSFANLFDEFLNPAPNWQLSKKSEFENVLVNIIESKEAFELQLNAPGRNKEDFSIHLENGILSIGYQAKANTEQVQPKFIRKEFSFPSFKRSFSVDEKIDATKIEANYQQGILTIHLPKRAEIIISPTKININ